MDNKKFMPAEWIPHDCTWMAWPPHKSANTTWKVPTISLVKQNMTNLIRSVAHFEPVNVLVSSDADLIEAKEALEVSSNNHVISFHLCPMDDIWVRDTGPTFCLRRSSEELVATIWNFNSWGGKFKTNLQDAAVAEQISTRALSDEVFVSRLILEGGSLHVDGEGTLLVTESSLLNPNRNPGWTKEQAEQELRETLGVEVTFLSCSHRL
jgi:agmatine deiminase